MKIVHCWLYSVAVDITIGILLVYSTVGNMGLLLILLLLHYYWYIPLLVIWSWCPRECRWVPWGVFATVHKDAQNILSMMMIVMMMMVMMILPMLEREKCSVQYLIEPFAARGFKEFMDSGSNKCFCFKIRNKKFKLNRFLLHYSQIWNSLFQKFVQKMHYIKCLKKNHRVKLSNCTAGQ